MLDKKIFISYSSQDEIYIDNFYNELIKKGFKHIYKYNRTSVSGDLWEVIHDKLDWSDIFLIFPSLDSEQSNAVKKELSIATNRSIKDDKFEIIPIYLNNDIFLNWALDSLLRIEAFKMSPNEAVDKLYLLLSKGNINFEPTLEITAHLNRVMDNINIVSKRNVILPRYIIVSKSKARNESQIGGVLIESNNSISSPGVFTITLWKIKNNNYFYVCEINDIKFLGIDFPSKFSSWNYFGIPGEEILSIGVLGLNNRIYDSKLIEETN